jgi:hypothetical protein
MVVSGVLARDSSQDSVPEVRVRVNQDASLSGMEAPGRAQMVIL